jgi:mono/diheme cytochrome c family protein
MLSFEVNSIYYVVMKKCCIPQYLISILVIGSTACVTATAQDKVIKDVPARMIASLEGKDLFREYCAVCHGVDAKGGGPAASALKKSTGDLTQLTAKHKGKFPALSVQVAIKGGNGIVEHGTGEMPIWGPIFSQTGQNKDLGDMRVMALVKYIEQIQAKPAGTKP